MIWPGTADITAAQFRALLPEFADSSKFTDEAIDVWLIVATAQLNTTRWGSLYNLGLALFAAHNIVLGRFCTLQALRGGVPGMGGFGLIGSKSINGVSISYNTNLAALQDGGDFNLTLYGIRFLGFARMVGSGGVLILGTDAAQTSEADLIRGDSTGPVQF
jgi:hypothetical protein